MLYYIFYSVISKKRAVVSEADDNEAEALGNNSMWELVVTTPPMASQENAEAWADWYERGPEQ